MERLVIDSKYQIEAAYAIMMTNGPGHWNKSRKTGTAEPPIDDEFRIHDGVILTGRRSWKEKCESRDDEKQRSPGTS